MNFHTTSGMGIIKCSRMVPNRSQYETIFSESWIYGKPTEGWLEGQIELRTIEHDGRYENWKIYLVALALDFPVFVALDDFEFM